MSRAMSRAWGIVLRAKTGRPRKCPRVLAPLLSYFFLGAGAPARGALGYKFLRGGTLFVDVGAGERGQDEFDEAYDRSDRQ